VLTATKIEDLFYLIKLITLYIIDLLPKARVIALNNIL
jgi:hypothetical protein